MSGTPGIDKHGLATFERRVWYNSTPLESHVLLAGLEATLDGLQNSSTVADMGTNHHSSNVYTW